MVPRPIPALAQVLDVEQILKNVMPAAEKVEINREAVGPALRLATRAAIILAAGRLSGGPLGD